MKKVYYVRATTNAENGWVIEKEVIRTSKQRAINALRKEIEVNYLHGLEAAVAFNGWDYTIIRERSLTEAYEEAVHTLTLETASLQQLTLANDKGRRIAKAFLLQHQLEWIQTLNRELSR